MGIVYQAKLKIEPNCRFITGYLQCSGTLVYVLYSSLVLVQFLFSIIFLLFQILIIYNNKYKTKETLN